MSKKSRQKRSHRQRRPSRSRPLQAGKSGSGGLIRRPLFWIFVVALVGGSVGAWVMNRQPEYAILDTSLGRIKCELFPDRAPKTVANFVELAEGTKEWTDPETGEVVKRRFYDGLTFHRVIPNFMIQGGDPLGDGTGGPGYQFEDEIDPGLQFDGRGWLAMANSGADTNGSQFFITVAPAPHLNGKHTIFGRVVEGQDVADKIANAPRDDKDKPLLPITIDEVTIER